MMRNNLIVLALLLSFNTAFSQDSEQVEVSFEETAEKLLQDAVTENKLIGIAAGFSVNSEMLWDNAQGFSNKKDGTALEVTTLIRTASITKPFTAIAILQLFEQGKLDLDLPIQEFLPYFPIKEEGDITTRHLLQHASGIGAYESGKERQNKIDYPNMEAAITVFKDRDLLATPGQAYNYTTYGYTLLGLIIEKVSGISYEEYLQTHFFEPLGMTNTSIEHADGLYVNKSSLYHRSSKGKIKAAKPTNISDRIPGGGIQSTVADLLKFGDAVLNNSLVKKETMDLMITDSGLKKEGNPYGMGWYLYGENPKHGNVFGHTGAQIGCSAVLFLLPEQQTSIVVLSNTSGAWQDVFKIGFQLFDVAARAGRLAEEK